MTNHRFLLCAGVLGLSCLSSLGGETRVAGSEVSGAPDLMPVTMRAAPNHAPVVLVRDGAPCAVVYRAGATPSANLQLLLDEWVEAVRLSTGATLPVVTNPPAAEQPALVVGDCEETRQAGIDAARLPIEGFEVKTAANRVYLVGSIEALPSNANITDVYSNDGTAWALADFLERFVGVRWYWPVAFGGRTVIRNANLVVPPVHYGDAPVFRKRSHFPLAYGGWWSRWFDPADQQPAPPAAGKGVKSISLQPVLAGLRMGNNWPYLIKVHQPQAFPWKDVAWAKQHESMFALQKDGSRNRGMLCYSAPATFDYLMEGAIQTWDKGKRWGYPWITELCFSISPGDQPVECYCAACRALFDEKAPNYGMAGGQASKLMGLFVKKVCEEVQRRWPDKKVIYLPYWNYALCPEEVEYPDNLTIEMATTGFGSFRETAIRAPIERNLRAWSRKARGRITSWEYSCWIIDWTHGPVQFPHLVQDYYRANRDLLKGSFINGGHLPEWSKCAPTLYVWQRVLWNPEIDVDATLDEMCTRLFGRGAPACRELLRLMCERWEKAPWNGPLSVEDGHLSPDVFRAVWPPETVARMETLVRQAREAIQDDPEALVRFDYWLWTFPSFLKEAGAEWAKESGSPPVGQAVTNDAPAHGRPFFMPESERVRLREWIATRDWARADYARIQTEAAKGNGRLAAFLYALDGDPAMARVAERWLLGLYGEKGYSVSRAREALASPDFFRLGVPHLGDVFYDIDCTPYVAFDWAHDGLDPAARETIRAGIATVLRYKMRCMDRWTQSPNLVFKPTVMVALGGLAIQDQEAIDWGFHRKPDSELGGYFPVLNNLLKDGGLWNEAPTYPITHHTLYCMSLLCRYRSLYDGKDWWSARVPKGGSPKGLMDFYIDTAYPIERTGLGPGQVRALTYGDGATHAEGDMFLANPAGPDIDMATALSAAYSTCGDPRLAPFVAMIPGYKPDLLDRRPLPDEVAFPPAPSKIWPDFGLAILRADESSDYWHSDAPVAVQLMTREYGHEHNDKFSLLLHGAGRLLYPDYNAVQYENPDIGWTRNTIAHNTLMVDEGETRSVTNGVIRHDFSPEVKYLATSASGVFADVAQTRALLLTRDYLLDLFQAESPVPRVYDYLLHSFGAPRPLDPAAFQPSSELDRRFWLVSKRQAMRTDGAWALDFVCQEAPGSRKGKFGAEWYDHNAAVRVTLAGEPATLVTHGVSGSELGKRVQHVFDPLGMLIVRRAGVRRTVFAAVHEPYGGVATPKVSAVTVLARSDRALLARVDAADYTDYAAVSFGAQSGAPEHALAADAGQGIRVAFKDYGYLRVNRDGTAVARGGWTGLRVPGAKGGLILNGKAVSAAVQDGCLAYGVIPAAAVTAPVPDVECPLTVQVAPAVARMAPGGRRMVTFTILNTLKKNVSGSLAFELPAGITAEPAVPLFSEVAPGQTAQVSASLVADAGVEVGRKIIPCRVTSRAGEDPPVTAAALPVEVTIGPVLEFLYRYPETNVYQVKAPRYVIRHDMFQGLCRYLADDDGTVRLDGSPLFTFGDEKEELLNASTRNAFTWIYQDPLRLKAHAEDVCQYHVGFGADRVTVRMDAGWGRFDKTRFAVPGEWVSPGGAPVWKRIIAVDAGGKEVEVKPGADLKVVAAELAFPDGGWSLAFQFNPPQAVVLDGTKMEFSIGTYNGDAWSVGFCRPGELDVWRNRH